MTRLEKYLLATASEIIEAETTLSRYFIIGNIKIRVSDHFAKGNDSDLQIIIPYNGGTKYMVTIKGSSKFIIWNTNQIKDFVPMLQVMKKLQSNVQCDNKPSAVQKIQLAMRDAIPEETTLKFNGIVKSTLKKLTKNEQRVRQRDKLIWTATEISTLPIMLRKDLKINHSYMNEDVQIFLTCTPITYCEILNIYKIITVDNKQIPTIKLLQEAYSLINKYTLPI